MTEQIQNPHTPQQERQLSNIGHWVEGAIVAGAGATLLLGALKGDERFESWARGLLTGAGVTLAVGLVAGSFHHGGPQAFFRADHQQRQHLQMATLIGAAGAARGHDRFGKLVSNTLIGVVGKMFLSHEQHGTGKAAREARRKHDRLGRTILAAAATQALGEVTDSRVMRGAGSVGLIFAGGQLLFLVECRDDAGPVRRCPDWARLTVCDKARTRASRASRSCSGG